MKLKLCIAFFFGMFLSSMHSQTLNIIPVTGSSSVFEVSNVKKMTFDSGNLLVSNTAGNISTLALAGNKNIRFTTEALSTPTNTLSKSIFYVYVNPISSILTISNLDTNAIISLYEIIALDGRLLKSKNRLNSNTEQVSITDLPQGIYVCRLSTNTNTQTIKFLKQ